MKKIIANIFKEDEEVIEFDNVYYLLDGLTKIIKYPTKLIIISASKGEGTFHCYGDIAIETDCGTKKKKFQINYFGVSEKKDNKNLFRLNVPYLEIHHMAEIYNFLCDIFKKENVEAVMATCQTIRKSKLEYKSFSIKKEKYWNHPFLKQ